MSSLTMKKIKHWAEYVLLRILAASIQYMPLHMALAIAWLLAALIHFVFRFRVQMARHRIREVFGERFTNRQSRSISWISWRNLCFNAVEIMRAPQINLHYIEKYVENRTLLPLQNLTVSGKGALLCVPHMGNWDLGGLSAHLMGIPFFFIARRQKNPYTDDYLNKMRQSTGAETIMSDDQRMLRDAVKRLKRGMVFAILPDVRSRTPALKIPFLNHTANIAHGLALFSHLSDVPILPALTRRIGWTHHVWVFGEPVYPDKAAEREQDFQRLTETVFQFFDQAIRDYPEQYFWYNKRWVLDPL